MIMILWTLYKLASVPEWIVALLMNIVLICILVGSIRHFRTSRYIRKMHREGRYYD